MKLRAAAALLALSLSSGCLAVDRWPKIEPPYSPDSIATDRKIYVRPKGGPPVTITKAKWVEEEGRAWIAGDMHVEPDGILDMPYRFYMEMTWEQEKPWAEPGRVAVDEVQTLRVEPPGEPTKNYTGLAVLLCLGLVVLVIALA